MARTKTMKVADGKRLNISRFPNFHKSGDIRGMKEKYYGNGVLLETWKEKDFPHIGYSDSYTWKRSGNLIQIRTLFLDGHIVGQEVTIFPWNVLAEVQLSYEFEAIPTYLEVGATFFGKTVGVSMYGYNCVFFDSISELVDFINEHKNDIVYHG